MPPFSSMAKPLRIQLTPFGKLGISSVACGSRTDFTSEKSRDSATKKPSVVARMMRPSKVMFIPMKPPGISLGWSHCFLTAMPERRSPGVESPYWFALG
jgi:hypothetical protein